MKIAGRHIRVHVTHALLITLLACASACSGAKGELGADGSPGAAGKSTLMRSTTVAPGSDCANGGNKLETGVDDDANGQLANAEVDFTVFVCDGAEGPGAVATLVAPGASCPAGGVMITAGAGAPTYVCNGERGAIGATGAPGVNGADGADGESVTVTPEPAGPTCQYGGQKLRVGSGSPSYVCNGAPGQDGTSVTMTPVSPGVDCPYGGQKLQVGAGLPAYACNGAPGNDGASVTMVPEPPGSFCEFGGVKLVVGAGPASYVCNAAMPGATRPLVQTVSVGSVRYTQALVNADVTDGGGELVLARGVAIATHAAPTLQDDVRFAGSGTGGYAVLCDGLAPATTHHVRAFATNALGTTYGDELTFTTLPLTHPTVSTATVANVTNASAVSGGSVGDDGGSPILSRGICWSAAAAPTLADACADEGPGAASFIAMMTGLSASTPYHVRAYATNAQGTAYGEDRTFTTSALQLASVTTAAPAAVSFTTVTLGGNVTSGNGAAVTSRGVCWSTTPEPTTAGAKYTEAGGLGSFSASITGLSASTTYYARAFAVNGAGTSYGNEVTFTTPTPSIPSIATKPVGGIASYIAGSGGVISTDGGSAITAKGVCWSLNPNPTIANSKTTDGAGSTSYNSTITGLSPLTTYYVRAYATNGLGTAYGNELSFTTTDLVTPGPTVPVVGTSTATIASSTTASSGGYVSSDGGSPVTARGVCWGTSANPTLADTCSTDGAGEGFFSSTVTGLSGCGVVYYVRAYATNSTGTGYGSQATVSTGLLPALTTAAVTDVGHYGAVSGGTITDDGGCPIAEKGVVWSWQSNPTTGNSKATSGTGSAPFAASITGLYANRTYFVRAYARNSVGTTYGQQEVFTTTEPTTPYVGQSYAGGIVFHVDGTGLHGLVVAPTDQGWFRWGCQGTNIPTDVTLGSGPTNTAAIVASCAESDIAARVADGLVLNGYDDWFLPSRDELTLVYTNLYAQGFGGFSGYYWSSTQASPSTAFWTYFDWFHTSDRSKGESYPVRAVRAF